MNRALIAVACMIVPAVASAAETPRQAKVSALIERATTAANEGHFSESLKLADDAVALADRTLPRRDTLRFEAARRRAVTMNFVDETASIAAFDRLGVVGDEVYGANSFMALFSRFKGAQWKYNARVKGFGLPLLAAAAEAAAAAATGDEQVTLGALGLSIVANFMSSVDIVAARAVMSRAVATADTVPNVTAIERGLIYGTGAAIALRDDRAAEALALSRQAVAIYEIDQGNTSHHLVALLSTQADALRRLGDRAGAEASLRRAVGIVDARPQLPLAFKTRALLDYARLLTDRGRSDLALPLAERAAGAVGAETITASFPQSVVITVGKMFQQAGQHDDALRHFRRALTMSEAAGTTTLFQGQVLTEMGRSEFALGDLATAEVTAERAMEVFDKAALPGSSARGRARLLLADLADARGETAAAATLYAKSASELQGTGPDAAFTAEPRIRHAAMLARLGRLDDAGWRDARDSSDALIRGVVRQAGTIAGDGAVSTLPTRLLDGALDVAWARGHAVQVGAR